MTDLIISKLFIIIIQIIILIESWPFIIIVSVYGLLVQYSFRRIK